MFAQEQAEEWKLTFRAGRVTMLKIDFRFGVVITDADDNSTCQLFIGSIFHLTNVGGQITLDPGEISGLEPALSLFNALVDEIRISRKGVLTAVFEADQRIDIKPNEKFEAWELGCSTGLLLVCTPGGSLAVFKKPIDTKI